MVIVILNEVVGVFQESKAEQAMAGSGVVPLDAMSIRQTIREKTRKGLVETNLKAFYLGMGAVAAGA